MMFWCHLLAVVFILLSNDGRAKPVVEGFPIGIEQVQHFQDIRGRRASFMVPPAERFSLPDSLGEFYQQGKVHWFKLQIINHNTEVQSLWLKLQGNLNKVGFYLATQTRRPNAVYNRYGKKTTMERSAIFRIDVAPGNQFYYLRVQSRFGFLFEPELVSNEQLSVNRLTENRGYGLYTNF